MYHLCYLWVRIRDGLGARESWGMSLTEENQPARAALRNIICQGQFAFAGDDALHFTASSDVGWDGSWILIRKEINCFSRLYTNSRTTVVCHFHLSSAFMGLYMTDCSFHLCTVSRYNALFHSKRTHRSISGKCIWECSNIWFISCHRLL